MAFLFQKHILGIRDRQIVEMDDIAIHAYDNRFRRIFIEPRMSRCQSAGNQTHVFITEANMCIQTANQSCTCDDGCDALKLTSSKSFFHSVAARVDLFKSWTASASWSSTLWKNASLAFMFSISTPPSSPPPTKYLLIGTLFLQRCFYLGF